MSEDTTLVAESIEQDKPVATPVAIVAPPVPVATAVPTPAVVVPTAGIVTPVDGPTNVEPEVKTKRKYTRKAIKTAKPKALKTRKPKAPSMRLGKSRALTGRISSDVTSVAQMRSIYEQRKKGMSFSQIEQCKRFNLRDANGMTAYRICANFKKMGGKRAAKK